MATQNAINLSAAGVVSYNGTGAFTGSPITQNAMLFGGAANAITSTAAAINGQILIGSTGVTPVLTTISAGTGISVTNGPGSITLATTGSPGAFPYTVVTTNTTLAANNGYIANGGGSIVFTLPVTAVVGDYFQIDGLASGNGWSVAQNASQSIQFNGNTSTVGVGGSLASTAHTDCVGFVCVVANTTWIVETAQGNITVT